MEYQEIYWLQPLWILWSSLITFCYSWWLDISLPAAATYILPWDPRSDLMMCLYSQNKLLHVISKGSILVRCFVMSGIPSLDCCTYHCTQPHIITCGYKEKFVILWWIGIIAIKVKKQGWSPTPADILVGI